MIIAIFKKKLIKTRLILNILLENIEKLIFIIYFYYIFLEMKKILEQFFLSQYLYFNN